MQLAFKQFYLASRRYLVDGCVLEEAMAICRTIVCYDLFSNFMGCEVVTHHDPSRHLTLGPKRVFFLQNCSRSIASFFGKSLGMSGLRLGRMEGMLRTCPPIDPMYWWFQQPSFQQDKNDPCWQPPVLGEAKVLQCQCSIYLCLSIKVLKLKYVFLVPL